MTWRDAAEIATVAMDVHYTGGGRGRRVVHRADDDPLAWWCLVELIMQRAYPSGDYPPA